MNRLGLEIELLRLDAVDGMLACMVRAAVAAGDAIKDLKTDAVQKDDDYVGFHAIVTKADILSQDVILSRLHDAYSTAYFIAEEEQDGLLSEKILTSATFRDHIEGLVFGVDSLDGTTQHHRGMYEWSVSVGAMQGLRHSRGVVYAPAVNGGSLFYGSAAAGVKALEGETAARDCVVAKTSLEGSLVQFGVVAAQTRTFSGAHHRTSNIVRTTTTNGSCALGLALVAAGKIDALIQPPQRVWDWFGGLPLVTLAGGDVRFFNVDESGFPVPFAAMQLMDYDPGKMACGFVAAESDMAARLFGVLYETE